MNETERRFFRHVDKPEWGVGVLIDERDGKRTIDFEHGKRLVIAQAYWGKLEEEAPDESSQAKILGVSDKNTKDREPRKSKKPKKDPGPRATFEQQVDAFRGRYPGGFADPAYAAERAPWAEAARKVGELDAAALGDATVVWARLRDILRESTLLHPVEVAQLTRAPEERQPAAAAALAALLTGAGDHAPRFDAWLAAFPAAKPTWTMATVLPALRDPGAHVFVKPGVLQDQARILGKPIDGYSTVPAGAVYDQFRATASDLLARLRAAGLAAADLLDAYAFAWRSLAAVKAAAGAAAELSDDDDD